MAERAEGLRPVDLRYAPAVVQSVSGDTAEERSREASRLRRAVEVLAVATKLGVTSFGGPVAHLGYFREEYVARRKWLDDKAYADLVALCQFLPGPASSQVGIGIGTMRAGVWGGILAWLGFTLPSAMLLLLFGLGVQHFDVARAGWLHGLKIAAVAVVAWAVWGMARTLTPDRPRITIAILAAAVMLLWTAAGAQVAVIAAAGLFGWSYFKPTVEYRAEEQATVGRGLAIASLVAFGVLLVALPVTRQLVSSQALAVADSFYRTGALVFGGGHVVLPLLQREVVEPGWVTVEQFTAGYGVAQAVPGPLFTFPAYLGSVMRLPPDGVAGAGLALSAVFLPSFLLVFGALPFWSRLRQVPRVQAALWGINAAVVGLLLAALYDPIWTSAILGPEDFLLALAAFGLLAFWKAPPLVVVAFAAGGGALLGL